MLSRINSLHAQPEREPHALRAVVYRFSGHEGDPGDDADDPLSNPSSAKRGDLPYRVELWNDEMTAVELVLAVTRNGSIGFAAYYEAMREYPSRYITLRHNSRILSRWNGPRH